MAQALIIILVYCVGPLAILVWAYKRYKHGIKPSLGESFIVIIAILFMVLFAVSSNWNISDRDSNEVDRIISEVVQRYDFPVKAKFAEAPAIRGNVRPHRLEIHIYGVIESAEQAKVVEVLTKLRRQVASKPVVVHFMREEVWEESSDGSRKPRRDREELVRKVRID